MRSPERSPFAIYLNELRKKRELTLRQLGTLAGIDHTYLSKIENDLVSVPSVTAIYKLAAALKATPEQLDQLTRLSDKLRDHPIEVSPNRSKEEGLLLKRIYSGAVNRAQAREMLSLIDNKKRGRARRAS